MQQLPTLELHVTNSVTYIKGGRMPSEIYKQLKKKIGWYPEDAIFRARQSKGKWDGLETTLCYNKKWCKCSIKKDGIHFPTGLFNKVRDFLTGYGFSLKYHDHRNKVNKNINLSLANDVKLRDYQKEVVDRAVKMQRGIIKMATGSGKTIVSAGIISELCISPFIFYVTSNDLLVQAKQEFEKFLVQNDSPLSVGVIGGGICDIKDINIMTVQTAVRACGEKYYNFDEEDNYAFSKDEISLLDQKRLEILNLIQNAKGFISDESQHWRSETAQIIADHSLSARYRYAASATPFRDKGDDILIDGCFGRQICDISASFLIDRKYLVQPDIYFVEVNDMPNKLGNYEAYYKEGIVNNIVRNQYIVNIAKSLYEEGRNILILCQRIEHGELLESLLPMSVFLHGSHSSKERTKHINEMRKGKPGVTISSVIFDEGVDCKPLDALILAGGGKSRTRALQRVGRVIRLFESEEKKKEDAVVIDFIDNCKYLRKHSRERRKIYNTEPLFNVENLEMDC